METKSGTYTMYNKTHTSTDLATKKRRYILPLVDARYCRPSLNSSITELTAWDTKNAEIILDYRTPPVDLFSHEIYDLFESD